MQIGDYNAFAAKVDRDSIAQTCRLITDTHCPAFNMHGSNSVHMTLQVHDHSNKTVFLCFIALLKNLHRRTKFALCGLFSNVINFNILEFL